MPKFAANLSMLFTENDFLDRFAAAAAAGFKGVEYLFPYAFPADDIAKRLADNGLTQVLFNLPAGDWDAGDRGIACLPDRVDEFRAGVDKAIDYAGKLGCKQVNCLAGIAPAAASGGELRQTFVGNLRFAVAKLQAAGIRLLIEPINVFDIPGFYLNHTNQALDIIAEVGSDSLFLQYDIYHMQRMEGELAATIERNLANIAHLQLADNPGRHEPGTGEINYKFLFEHIDRIGYQGWIGCEYKPATNTIAGLGWMAKAI
jgi:hydroxypyruvate isomerase